MNDLLDWIDRDIKELIENEILFNEDVEEILYDDDWILFKQDDFYGGEVNGDNESDGR